MCVRAPCGRPTRPTERRPRRCAATSRRVCWPSTWSWPRWSPSPKSAASPPPACWWSATASPAGQGGLANRLATVEGTSVVGVDVNPVELDQARRVFAGRPHLRFVAGDLTGPIDAAAGADIAVVASVIQYLPDPAAVFAALLRQLPP